MTRAWIFVGLMWLAWFLNYTDRQVVFSLYPVLRSELGFTDVQLGMVGSIFLWVYALMSPVAGWIGDRFSKRSIVVWSLVLWSAATALTGMSRSPAALLGFRALIGIVEGLFWPAAAALTAAAFPPEGRSRALGALSSAQLAGVVMGGWFGGWMAERHSWRWAFYVLGIAGILYAIPYRVLLRKLVDEPAPAPSSAGSPFRSPRYGALCVVFPLFCFALWLMYAWLPDYLFERFGLSLADAGFAATAFMQGGTLAGILVGGAAADRLYRRTASARFWLLVAGLLLVAPSLFLASRADSLELAKAATASFGIGCGLFISNLFAAALDVVPAGARASAVGGLNLLGGLVSGLAAYLGGEFRRSAGIPALMTIAAGSCLLSAALVVVVIKIKRAEHEDHAHGSDHPRIA